MTWTFIVLGPNLTDTVVTRKVHGLVTTGPSRWVRHPFHVAALAVAGRVIRAGPGRTSPACGCRRHRRTA